MNLNRRQFLERGTLVMGASLVATMGGERASALLPGQSATPATPADMISQSRQAAANTPIKTTKLADNLFLLQGTGGNMVAQTGPDGTLLIDSSFATAAPHIQEALGKLDGHPLRLLVNTHWHFDHTDGNAAMHEAGAFIVAHKNTRVRLSTPQEIKSYHLHIPASPAGGLPQQTFDTSEVLYLNNDELALVHIAPAHTDSDIYISFKNGNVLHCGDLWFNGFYPFIDDSSGGNIRGMIQGCNVLLGVADDKTKIVPGHGPLGDKAALTAYRDMLATSADRVGKLKASGQSLDQVLAAKPTADLDANWGKGMMSANAFTTLVYNTLP
jgi:glyoxylase-like metal-dependent hydrolase (beta-lactamase superfamily II)